MEARTQIIVGRRVRRAGARNPVMCWPFLAPVSPPPVGHAGAHRPLWSSPSGRCWWRGSCWLLLAAGGRVAGAAEPSASAASTRPPRPPPATAAFGHGHQRGVPGGRHQQPRRESTASPRTRSTTQQINAINLYVNQINQSGGINGRKINAMIEQFDPTNDANMQSLCSQWTQGNPPVFAVLDGIGTWEQDFQLCVTQQGHTPLISAWSTVTDWTNLGSPYLWWTGADMAPVLAATVKWGLSSGRLAKGKTVGVVVSDEAADQQALKTALLPDLKKAGVKPMVETVAGNPDETATTNSDAQLAVGTARSSRGEVGVPLARGERVLPLHRCRELAEVLPQLLLSDYESTIEVALGLIPVPYEQALNGQEGVTTETLGGFDDNRPEAKGGYDPGVRSCYDTWHAVSGRSRRDEPLHRGAGSGSGVVRRDPPLRHGSEGGRAEPQPPDLRRSHVEDKGLPRHALPGVELRPQQVLRPDAVPGRQGPQQRAAVVPVQVEDEPQAAGHLLGHGAGVPAAAGWLTFAQAWAVCRVPGRYWSRCAPPWGIPKPGVVAPGLAMANDEAALVGGLPDGEAWAGRAPCIEHFVVGTRTCADPLEQIEHQGLDGVGQRGPPVELLRTCHRDPSSDGWTGDQSVRGRQQSGAASANVCGALSSKSQMTGARGRVPTLSATKLTQSGS